MDEFLPFGSRYYCLFLLLLLFARGMDVLSTWVATPNLLLEGNPLAKKLGWRWGIPVQIAACFALAFSPISAIAVSTMSVLIAARNFQSAWLMRTLGEHVYRDWHVQRIQETRASLYLFCLFAQTTLFGIVGVVVLYFGRDHLVSAGVGIGIIAYAVAVTFYTLLSIWRLRRAYDKQNGSLRHVFTNHRSISSAGVPGKSDSRHAPLAGGH